MVPVTVAGTVPGTVSGKAGSEKTALSGERRGTVVRDDDGIQVLINQRDFIVAYGGEEAVAC